MHQFLTQSALIDWVLVFGRGRRRCSRIDRLGGGERKLLMDMGLDRQALKEKAQQREDGQPPAGGGGSHGGMSRTRHKREIPRLRIMRSAGLPQSQPLFFP